jgi:hypothetical protein
MTCLPCAAAAAACAAWNSWGSDVDRVNRRRGAEVFGVGVNLALEVRAKSLSMLWVEVCGRGNLNIRMGGKGAEHAAAGPAEPNHADAQRRAISFDRHASSPKQR